MLESSEVYVFCGSDHFDINKFIPISNTPDPWVKPNGGMWSSPVNSNYTWEEWCNDNYFNLEKLDKKFFFKLTKNARIYKIESNKDLDELYSQGFGRDEYAKYRWLRDELRTYYLDFEKLQLKYDAIQVTITNETYWSLYGWDCDTLLVLNPDCVIEIE